MVEVEIDVLKSGFIVRFSDNEIKTVRKFVKREIYDSVEDLIKLTLEDLFEELERGDYVKIEDPQ